MRAHDGYTLEARASFILEGLGIPVALHRQELASLSGGFKLRVLLAQTLFAGADVLMLCEVDVGMARTGNRHTSAALAGFFAIWVLFKLIQNRRYTPFVVYRWALGLFVFANLAKFQ